VRVFGVCAKSRIGKFIRGLGGGAGEGWGARECVSVCECV